VALLHVMGRSDLAQSENFMSMGWRVAHNSEIDAIVTEWTQGRTTAEAIDALNRSDIAASPIRDFSDLMEWKHLRERDMLQPLSHPTEALAGDVIGAGFPIKLSRTHKGYTDPAPALGQNNTDIYAGLLGLTERQIAELRDRQII
jgi:crotonobetainyl-CoA:carnitine CoA-transferase CaiB-like acyl-CoA transferase